MDKKTLHIIYREIACEAIKQGLNDFLSGIDDEKELRNWIEESTLFDYLDLDRQWFIDKIIQMKNDGVKTIYGGEYGSSKTKTKEA